jgi:hypothetical protein
MPAATITALLRNTYSTITALSTLVCITQVKVSALARSCVRTARVTSLKESPTTDSNVQAVEDSFLSIPHLSYRSNLVFQGIILGT